MAKKRNNEELETTKKKLRYADTKYRHKKQFLYDVMKKNFDVKPTKDRLLNALGQSIVEKQNDFVEKNSLNKLNKIKEEFSKLYHLEEQIWKKEASTSSWWSKVQEILKEFIREDMNSSAVINSNDFMGYLKQDSLVTEDRPREKKRKSTKKDSHSEEYCFDDESDFTQDWNKEFYENFSEPREKYFPSEYLLNNPNWPMGDFVSSAAFYL